MPRVLVLLVLSACGRFGFGEPPVTSDGSAPADVPGFSLDATIVSDGVAAEETCGSTMLLQDGFDTAGAAPMFTSYADTGLTVLETGSVLQISFASNVSDGRYAGYYTVTPHPTEGLCGFVRIVDAATSNGLTFFKLMSTDQQVEFIVYQGELRVRTHLQKSVATLLAIPFDPRGASVLAHPSAGGRDVLGRIERRNHVHAPRIDVVRHRSNADLSRRLGLVRQLDQRGSRCVRQRIAHRAVTPGTAAGSGLVVFTCHLEAHPNDRGAAPAARAGSSSHRA